MGCAVKFLVAGQTVSQVVKRDASLYKKACFLDNPEAFESCQDAKKMALNGNVL